MKLSCGLFRFDSFRLVSSGVLALVLLPSGNVAAKEFTQVSLMAGLRQDTLDWNIRDYAGPNVLSELTWRDLNIFQLRGDVVSVNADRFYFRGSAAFGWVQSGENQDSDYAGNDRSLEFSRSVNDVDGSKVTDIKGGVGFVIPFGTRSQHSFAPVLGYAHHSQDLRMKDGQQVVSNSAYYDLINPDPAYDVLPPGPFPGLNSSYDATWRGVWLGLDFMFDLDAGGDVIVRVEHHWPRYSAEADWNLRTEFAHPVSFEHEADGRGLVLEIGWASVPMQGDWQWGVNLGWQRWKTRSGTDRIFFADNTEYEAILNEVNWSTSQISLTINKEIHL